jgi:hypothetical protein
MQNEPIEMHCMVHLLSINIFHFIWHARIRIFVHSMVEIKCCYIVLFSPFRPNSLWQTTLVWLATSIRLWDILIPWVRQRQQVEWTQTCPLWWNACYYHWRWPDDMRKVQHHALNAWKCLHNVLHDQWCFHALNAW